MASVQLGKFKAHRLGVGSSTVFWDDVLMCHDFSKTSLSYIERYGGFGFPQGKQWSVMTGVFTNVYIVLYGLARLVLQVCLM